MPKHAPHDDARTPAACDAPSAWNNPFTAAFGKAGEAYFKACIDWQQEMARFVGVRFAEDRRTQETLAACSNFGDAFKAQQEWALTAAKTYAEEATRLAQIATRALPTDAIVAEQPRQTPHENRAHAAE